MNCASKSQAFKTWKKNNIAVFAGQFFFVYRLFSLCWGRKKYTCQDSSETLHLILKKYTKQHLADQTHWNFIS